MKDPALILIIAVCLDFILGDPNYRLHPVRIIGRTIQTIETILMRMRLSGLTGGILLLVLTCTIVTGILLSIHYAVSDLSHSLTIALDVFIVYSCIALKDMFDHVKPITQAIRNNNDDLARKLVQKIVGRDAFRLSRTGIIRATIESISESFLDGLLAPVFWFSTTAIVAYYANLPVIPLSVLAILIYRTVNTLDSMVGHTSDIYILFGRASAKTDDFMNFIPARVSIPLLALASAINGGNTRNGWNIAVRDRLKHASPNSAHTESFTAGMLGIRLGGPTIYHDGIVEKPWLGENTNEPDLLHIATTCRLFTIATILLVLILSGIMLCI